ncbi:hypothetical protein DLAC_07200 [Tieghemostelium lacteum]|uniref:Uncharacterized protein n=1 Tax=Tieghemostelium lacteum TaxID=361077 RepID=A0A151ZDF7_TIELA|nr:hypothetical protein DLAC_07200 [Tieghemostelium lacteum]|eukprot:KYQ91959.1 hypothetical protein DLAC_07200 [Tieghemostelium lacteum]
MIVIFLEFDLNNKNINNKSAIYSINTSIYSILDITEEYIELLYINGTDTFLNIGRFHPENGDLISKIELENFQIDFAYGIQASYVYTNSDRLMMIGTDPISSNLTCCYWEINSTYAPIYCFISSAKSIMEGFIPIIPIGLVSNNNDMIALYYNELDQGKPYLIRFNIMNHSSNIEYPIDGFGDISVNNLPFVELKYNQEVVYLISNVVTSDDVLILYRLDFNETTGNYSMIFLYKFSQTDFLGGVVSVISQDGNYIYWCCFLYFWT